MLSWLKGRRLTPPQPIEAAAKPTGLAGRVMSGTYLSLHKYLKDRYATTVVLTFAEIEDLLGFPLPVEARLQKEWWTAAATAVVGPNHSDSWTLARRTATPNLVAQTVIFERTP